jgi:tight adherence protein B
MMLLILTLAVGCVLAAAVLVYLMWIARTRQEEFSRLLGLLSVELAPARPGPSVSIDRLVPRALARRCHQAGWIPQVRDLVVMLAGLVSATALAAWRFGALTGVLTCLAVLLAAGALLEMRARRRMRALSDAMLGFLERVRQLITVGNSLATALERAVANSPPVVALALAPTIRRIHNGGGVAESLERCAEELDIYELNLLATAARTNLRFGGSMTQILRNMIENIRRRSAVERELRADTTQIRASAWVLGLLPVVVGGVVMFSNRDYARWFLETDSGHRMIVYAVLSQLIGVWLMRMVVRTRY